MAVNSIFLHIRMSARISPQSINSDLFLYKTRFISFVLLLAYTFLHTRLTVIYIQVTLEQMLDFCTRMPFAQRLLVPAMAKLLSSFLPFSPGSLFFLLEFLFTAAFFFSLQALLQRQLSRRASLVCSWLFLLLLPLLSVVNYRIMFGGPATFYYPSDSASLFFISMGFLLCLQKRWTLLLFWIFLSTFNRESSILLVLLIPALHWSDRKQIAKPMIAAVLLYILARLIILHLTKNSPGPLTEWYDQFFGHTYFETNFNWLFRQLAIFLVNFCFMGLPLLWFAFIDYIPPQLRPIRFIALFYFLGLQLIGNFSEVRIFHEIVILLYLPVCTAVNRWIQNEPFYEADYSHAGLFFLNRYAVSLILLATTLAHPLLEPLVVKIANLSGSKNHRATNEDWYDKYYR
ncbi:hypothetical protein [Legionella sp. 16cNR16C]|uniref:hypothetical protein n=1 Tax=Legionella sp. 16cNR16C TaxID=2905656 RepID=UPI001E4452B8|nr:hypothetical protein [Legionella sp. 16cNR16C]MCE3043490.1 hypothetical protein [Legionella sp. 16cNR16C]